MRKGKSRPALALDLLPTPLPSAHRCVIVTVIIMLIHGCDSERDTLVPAPLFTQISQALNLLQFFGTVRVDEWKGNGRGPTGARKWKETKRERDRTRGKRPAVHDKWRSTCFSPASVRPLLPAYLTSFVPCMLSTHLPLTPSSTSTLSHNLDWALIPSYAAGRWLPP